MIEDSFATALSSMGLELDEPLALRLQEYARAMWQYNEQVNLTRHTTWDLFVGRDLRDVLQLAMLLQPGEEVLDLGSGNGVPGIPLAILRPDIEIALAESVGKRARVLDELVAELKLPIAVYAARGEDILEDFRFSTIVSRAVGSLAKFCRWMQPHWSQVDRLLLVKGPKWVQERGEARHLGVLKGIDLRVVATYPLGPPNQEAQEAQEAQESRVPEKDRGLDGSQEPEDSRQPDKPLTPTEYGDPGEGVILQLSRKRS